MTIRAIIAMLALVLGMSTLTAEEPKKETKKDATTGIKGAFTKSAGDFDLTFTFMKNGKLSFLMKNTNSGDGMKMEATYTIDKDGKLEMTVESSEKIGDFPTNPPKGAKYGFVAKMKEKKLVISDLTGDDTENAKDIVEGEYEPAKPKK